MGPEYKVDLDQVGSEGRSAEFADSVKSGGAQPSWGHRCQQNRPILFHFNIERKRSIIGYSKVGNGFEDQKKINRGSSD